MCHKNQRLVLPPRLTQVFSTEVKKFWVLLLFCVYRLSWLPFFLLNYIGIIYVTAMFMQKKQHTVTRDKQETELIARGRHDPCVVPRGLFLNDDSYPLTEPSSVFD